MGAAVSIVAAGVGCKAVPAEFGGGGMRLERRGEGGNVGDFGTEAVAVGGGGNWKPGDGGNRSPEEDLARGGGSLELLFNLFLSSFSFDLRLFNAARMSMNEGLASGFSETQATASSANSEGTSGGKAARNSTKSNAYASIGDRSGGLSLTIISYKMTPNENTSAFKLYADPTMISGAIQVSVYCRVS